MMRSETRSEVKKRQGLYVMWCKNRRVGIVFGVWRFAGRHACS
jgi:hypothetical protein